LWVEEVGEQEGKGRRRVWG